MNSENILEILTQNNILFRIHHHEPVFTMEDVETKLPFPEEKLLKTLVFKLRESFWILAVIKSKDKIDYRKLAVALGILRSKLEKPTALEIEGKLGFQLGGMSPIPTIPNEEVRVVVDEKIRGMNRVYCGIGKNDRSLEIMVDDLISLSKAQIMPISK